MPPTIGPVRVCFNDVIPVSYGQFYVISDRDFPDLSDSSAGQQNGLCGAAIPGALFLVTSTHTGRVRLRVELLDTDPGEADPEWEEVVEASFLPTEDDVRLEEWGGGGTWDLDLGGHAAYRVRYCATGMARHREVEWTEYGEPARDHYLMQFWPVDSETQAPDAVLRQTTAEADYWHRTARRRPLPPTLTERVEAARLAELERERKQDEYRRQEEVRWWGGRAPSDRLRTVHGNIFGLVKLDRDLVDAVAAVDPDRQRAIARWAARHAYTFAGIGELDWVAPALAALDRGDPLPEPFDDPMKVWNRFLGGRRLVTRVRAQGVRVYREPQLPAFMQSDVDPVAMAVPALFAAVEADPLQAALEALWAAATAYGRDARTFLADVRRTFPDLD